MADSASTPPAPPSDQMANLQLDPVTGERVSKSELKKRIKARETEKKKARWPALRCWAGWLTCAAREGGAARRRGRLGRPEEEEEAGGQERRGGRTLA